jgi:hypothetical protein
MKVLFLLLGLYSFHFSTGQNRITVKREGDGKATFTCSLNNQPVDCSELNTTEDIPIVLDAAFPKEVSIVVTDHKGKPTGSHANNAKVISGSEEGDMVYSITIRFSAKDSLKISPVGPGKKAQEASKDLLPGTNARTDKDCKCHGQDKTNHNENIIKALDLCPDCGDENYYVYDAHCKTLYRRKDKNEYERIKYLQNVKFTYKKEFKIKVIHINRYLKDVTITADDLMYKSEAPPLFDDFFGASGQLIGKLREGISALASKDSSLYKEFEKKLEAFVAIINELKETRDQAYSLCCEATKNCGEIALPASFSQISSRYFDLTVSYNKLLKELKRQTAERDAAKAKLAKVNEEWTKAKDADKPALAAAQQRIEAELQQFAADLDDNRKGLEELWAAFEKPTANDIRKLVLFAKNYLKENYTFSTPPIYPLGNRMNVKLNIDSKDDLEEFRERILPTDHQALEIEGPVLNKWLFSFSSGPFIGFSDALYETNYEFQKVPSSGNRIDETALYNLTASGTTNPPLGLSALAHFENKFAENFGAGASIGVGLTIENKPRPAYLAGVSFFIGDARRFALTGGVAAMQVDVLKKDLYPDGLLYKSTEPLKYYKDLRMGGFFSITYTFFTIESKNKQPKISTNSPAPSNK